LVLNIDETGHQEWADASAEKTAVPDLYEEATIRTPVEAKHATLLVVIATDRTHLKRFTIINRETCEDELFQTEYTPDKVVYASQESGLIAAELFGWWAFPRISLRHVKNSIIPDVESSF
jgi:hypothetical protein